MNYPKFTGSKYFCTGEISVQDKSWPICDEVRYVTKATFVVTKSYKKYLDAKRKFEQQEELRILKQKLEYQYKTYGEIDEIDFQEYQYKLKLYGAM